MTTTIMLPTKNRPGRTALLTPSHLEFGQHHPTVRRNRNCQTFQSCETCKHETPSSATRKRVRRHANGSAPSARAMANELLYLFNPRTGVALRLKSQSRNMRSRCRCSMYLQFALSIAASCALHRPMCRVIHRSE